MSWEEGSEDRRARLAALRKNRFRKPAPEDSAAIPLQEEPNSETQPPLDHHEASEPTRLDQPPTLHLEGGETVEVLSNQAQQRILQSARERANDISFDKPGFSKKESYTKDLEISMQDLLVKADHRTQRAIFNIIKTKYETYNGA